MTTAAVLRRGGAFRRILVAYDGSREAQDALRVAVELGEAIGGDVRVLLVARPPAHAETAEDRARAEAAESANLSRGLHDALEPYGRSLPEPRVVFADDPASAIAGHAAEHGFDLIVVGSHGREHATHRGLGESLQALLRHHPCPVLVV